MVKRAIRPDEDILELAEMDPLERDAYLGDEAAKAQLTKQEREYWESPEGIAESKRFNEAEPRMVFFVMETQTNEDGEYRALIAVEGERGYHLTDWFWGRDYAVATKIANDRNAEIGIDAQASILIQLQTMR